jgi:hypothetical protein
MDFYISLIKNIAVETREWVHEQGMNLYIYLYLVIFLFFLSIVFFIKWKYPFWNTIPTFHSYDWWRYLVVKPQVIREKYIPVLKNTGYYNSEKVKTYSYDILSDSMKGEMMDLMKKYYSSTDNTFNINTIENIHTMMTGQIEPSYASFYSEPIIDGKGESHFLPMGCLTSRLLNLRVSGETERTLYYLDYLSISKEKTKEKRTLIATHLNNQRQLNPSVKVGLFKKEGILIDGLVPFVQFKSLYFSLNADIKTVFLRDHFTVVRIYNENVDCLQDFLNTYSHLYELTIMGDLSHLMGLIKGGILYIYVLKKEKDICGFYFIRNEKVEWAYVANIDQGTGIRLIGSWNQTYPEIFYRGFLIALKEIMRENSGHKILTIDDISHNHLILLRWTVQVGRPFMEHENAYYFYNYLYPHRDMKFKCLILT